MQKVLVLGAPRSGTSYLTSILGAHSKVAAECEHWTEFFPLLAGKPIIVNKLIVPVQIRYKFKLPKHIIWFLRFFLYRLRIFPLLPWCSFSLNDYPEDTKFIVVDRDLSALKKSIIFWTRKEDIPLFWSRRKYAQWCIDNFFAELDKLYMSRPACMFHVIFYDEDVKGFRKEDIKELCEFLKVKYEDHMLISGSAFNPIYKAKGEKW